MNTLASDTPRTDAETRISTGDCEWVHAAFARRLERELNEAKATIEDWEKDR